MYKIIGADQKEYGPISGDHLRQWIAEGRVNGHTQALADGATQWQPLSAYAEFATALGLEIPPTPPEAAIPSLTRASNSNEAALQEVKAPAIALIVVASLGIAYYTFSGLVTLITGGSPLQQDMPPNIPPQMRAFIEGMHGPLAGIISLMIAAMNGFVLFGAIKLMRLQSYTIAIVACVVAMLPCQCCCLLGLPLGIWALIILNKPDVKASFR